MVEKPKEQCEEPQDCIDEDEMRCPPDMMEPDEDDPRGSVGQKE
jgi:hypothetical protein